MQENGNSEVFELPHLSTKKPLKISGLKFVEPAGIEPASKHIPKKLSTCLFMH